jgi:hypothetical protein
MTSPKNVIRRQLVIHWLLGASALLYVLSRFVPYAPAGHYWIIDDSWMQVLHMAFNQHWQFGRDIVFTFGPWGFLYGGYYPATHLISVIIWIMLSMIFSWAAWRAARLCFGHGLIAWVWLMVFSIVASVTVFNNLDARLTAWILLLLLLYFFAEDQSFTATQVSLVISLGLLSLIKFSILMPAAVAVSAIATDNIWRQRRFPWIAPVFGASLLFFWGMAGQHLSSLIPFILNSWRITSGYTEAMNLVNATETRDVCLFLTATATLGALTGYVAWKRYRLFGMLPLTALGFVAFTAFKYGYVRHDGHELTALMELLLEALTCLALTWPLARKKGIWALLLIPLPTLAIVLFISVIFSTYSETGFISFLARTLNVRNMVAPVQLFRGQKDMLEAHEDHLAEIRDQFPIPQIKGSVDVYPWNQATILAHGLRYHQRPVIQSYSAYTPELAELNADFLKSDRAPDNILFQIVPIDNHFPALDDGLSWPELLTRYDVKNTDGSFLLLTRSTTPRKYQLVLLKDAAVPFGMPATLPAGSEGPVWAEIEINKSLLGSIISTLYKPPALMLTVFLHNGRQENFRLIPGMARSGFLLSPLVDSEKSFARLASHDGLNALANMEITSVIVSAATESGSTLCYQSPIKLRFYRLDYPQQDLNNTNSEPVKTN